MDNVSIHDVDEFFLETPYGRRATPFTRAWYAVSLVIGTAILLGGLVAPLREDEVLLPPWLILWLAGFMIIGSILLLWGSRETPRLDRAWSTEQFGCYVAGAGWGTYGVADFFVEPRDFSSWMFGIAFLVTLIVRLITLNMREKVTRSVTEKHSTPPGDD